MKYLHWPQLVGVFLLLTPYPGIASSAEFAVASAHPLATQAGIEALKRGGNAFDAAIAVTSTLAVVEPYSSGLGGGGFYLLHQQDSDKQIMLDARERAPLKAHRDMYLKSNGEVDHDLSMNGALSAGIPGIPAALEFLQLNYGVLTLAQNLSSAIKQAEEGFAVDPVYHRLAKFRLPVLQRYRSSGDILLRDGEVPQPGSLIKQPDLANTLRQIARQGAHGFYQGEVARKLVASVQAHGGIWSMQDLNQYQVVLRKPVRFRYGSAAFVTASLPSSGGLVLAGIFKMLQALNYDGANSQQKIHLLVEAMRRAYRDRAAYMGDEDYVDVPTAKLLSPAYIKSVAATISATQASKSLELGAIVNDSAGTDTTHFSIIDAQGNMVSATLSVNYPFGSGLIADGTGVLLNDEMDDFSASPGVPNAYGLLGSHANAIQPGKRMLSSMTPAFVHLPDKSLIVGTPGGSRIITMQLLAMLAFLNGADAQAIVSRPRFHHQFFPDKIFYEAGAFDQPMLAALKTLGHQLQETSYQYGNMHAIIVNHKNARLDAASDPRGIGQATISSIK